MLLNWPSNIRVDCPQKELSRLNIIARNISAIALGLLILHWWEDIFSPSKALASYDPLAEICDQRAREKEEFDNRVSKINLEATDIRTVITNLDLITADYNKMKAGWRFDRMRLFRYLEYIKKNLIIVAPSLNQKQYQLYDDIRVEMSKKF